jgi:MYXO-CTERM domain-containing protein
MHLALIHPSTLPLQIPWCGDGICSVAERDYGTCVADCTPKIGDAICDPFLDCHLTPSIPAWECDLDCPCDDGNACTQGDVWQNEVCVGSEPVTCTAADECHEAATCDPAMGCSNPQKEDGTTCTNGTCLAGICIPKIDTGTSDGPDGDDTGCSCKTTGDSWSNTASWLGLGLLALAGVRRRSSRQCLDRRP